MHPVWEPRSPAFSSCSHPTWDKFHQLCLQVYFQSPLLHLSPGPANSHLSGFPASISSRHLQCISTQQQSAHPISTALFLNLLIVLDLKPNRQHGPYDYKSWPLSLSTWTHSLSAHTLLQQQGSIFYIFVSSNTPNSPFVRAFACVTPSSWNGVLLVPPVSDRHHTAGSRSSFQFLSPP